MTSGGARVTSGPAPDPNAQRRDRKGDAATWTTLPEAGREGEPPGWPLIAQTSREADLWADLWSRPQATMWERLAQTYEVAMFVRNLARAEEPRASIELQKVVRQYLDSLGLSTQGMLRNRWKIGPSAATVSATKRQAAAPRPPSSRTRLKVVNGDGES